MKIESLLRLPSAVLLAISLSVPALCRAETPAAKEEFSNPALSDQWTAAKGTWTVENGKLKGVELASDDHAAVMTRIAPHMESKVSFSFQLAGSEGFSLSFNRDKGHLFRINISQTGAALVTDKDKKDPESKSISLDKKAATFEQGKTYTLTCETKGDSVKVSFDNGLALAGSHPSLATKKTGYRLVLKGAGVLFDDFTIHSAN